MGSNTAGLTVVCVLLVIRLLAARPRVRRAASRHASAWGAWIVDHLDPPSEADRLDVQMWLLGREQRLREDLNRVQRLLPVDFTMSATRQVANRIAYAGLLEELDRVRREVADLVPDARLTSLGSIATVRHGDRPGPRVELLEIGPARRGRYARRGGSSLL